MCVFLKKPESGVSQLEERLQVQDVANQVEELLRICVRINVMVTGRWSPPPVIERLSGSLSNIQEAVLLHQPTLGPGLVCPSTPLCYLSRPW